MKKISVLAIIVALGVAAPAFAQTPSDIRNGRSTVTSQDTARDVKIDRHSSGMRSGDMGSKEHSDMAEGKPAHHHKHHGKTAHHGKHHGKKHAHKADMKNDAKKNDNAGK